MDKKSDGIAGRMARMAAKVWRPERDTDGDGAPIGRRATKLQKSTSDGAVDVADAPGMPAGARDNPDVHKIRLEPVPGAGNKSNQPVRLVDPRTTIGRARTNALILDDPEVSKRHAVILRTQRGFVVRDLSSSNGTYVNGRLIKTSDLLPGDVVEFGNSRYSVVLDEGKDTTTVHVAPSGPEDKTQVLAAAHLDDMPESSVGISEFDTLRAAYDRVRVAFEAVQGLVETTDIRALCERILEVTFQLVAAESGAVLLFDESGNLVPWASRARDAETTPQIVVSRTIVDQVIRKRAALLASDALKDSRWSDVHSVVMSGLRSLMCVPLVKGDQVFGILHVGNAASTSAFTRPDLELLGGIGTGAGVALSNAFLAHRLAQEARSRESLGRFLSPALVDQVVENRITLERGGQEREISILFADIRGFTNLSERSRARDVVALLNEYFDKMVEVVFRHNGVLDKFIGDALMAVWGSLVRRKDDAAEAVAAAREMQQALLTHNDERRREGKEAIGVGIGIASGESVVGAIGARRRMEFTVIGDAVNLASRLCTVAEAGEIICDEETYIRAGKPADARRLPRAQVKGKEKPVSMYRL